MFSFLKNKPKEEQTTCVLVVNSYSVIAAVVRTYHREGAVAKPVVLFSSEEKIGEVHGVEVQMKKVLEQCRKVHGNYDKLVCVVGEPWLMTKARQIDVEKQKPFKVTQKIIDEAIARDMRLFEQEALRDYARDEEWGILNEGKPLIDIHGYRTDHYLGMMAKSITIRTQIALAPTVFIENVIGAYADVFHRVDVAFVGIDAAIGKLVRQHAHATVLVLGGISSKVATFEHGVLGHTEICSEGLARFESDLADSFETYRSQVDSIMKFAHDEKFLDHERDVYYQRIEAAFGSMITALRAAFVHIKKQEGYRAGPIILIASPAWATILRPLIEKNLEVEIVIPEQKILEDSLVYTHNARVKNIPMSLAILADLEK